MFEVPKSMLVDSFEYQEYKDKDRNHTPIYADAVEIEHVRIDRAAVYTRNGSESVKRADGTIYCFKAHTNPFVPFKAQSRVTFDNQSYTVTDVRPFTAPFNNQVVVYEMEVVV